MRIIKVPVESNVALESNVFLLKAYAPEIASIIKPGQFCNIKVSDSSFPLLRRPFSVCDVLEDYIFFMFDLVGEGTRLLAKKKQGDIIDILGPLGKGFNIEGEYEIAIIAAGGLGTAPFPFLTRTLPESKKILTFIGGRSGNNIISYGLKNISTATDDGTLGFKGTVVELMEKDRVESVYKSKIFACGPTPMLRALKSLCLKYNLHCEVSTECAMACGFGICQGCPIHAVNEDKYLLVCRDGPVFNIKDVIL